ncbi:MAG: Tetratricopeptide repeat protein [Candidatus Hydrogenedentes bacterium]|nr:Tetratricopeptide repeat protein [Candidatus Hydrogenedentota bacterium]
MSRAVPILAAFALTALSGASADRIVADGQTYDGVYVRESPSMYYVQFPADGRVSSFAKDRVTEVELTGDTVERERLRRLWEEARTPKTSAPPSKPEPVEAPLTLGGALKAELRKQNLDYRVENGFVWISTPDRLRRESFEPLETRTYTLNSGAQDTLPKIVVRNMAGSYGGYAGGVSGGNGTRATGSYGTNSGTYSAGTGSVAGSGRGAVGGMYGGSGTPIGSQGAVPYGPGLTGPHVSNLAELFTNIDDRLVGETPAVIGLSGVSNGR